MDPNTGRIIQFQSEEDKAKYEAEMRFRAEKLGEFSKTIRAQRAFSTMIGLGNPPKAGCEFCGGAGAVQSTITLKWIPCRCTNPDPVPPHRTEEEKK